MDNLNTSQFGENDVIPLTEGQFLEIMYHETPEKEFYELLPYDCEWTIDLSGEKPVITFFDSAKSTFVNGKWTKYDDDDLILLYQVPDRFVNELMLTMLYTNSKNYDHLVIYWKEKENRDCSEVFEESRQLFREMARIVLSGYKSDAEYNIIYSTFKMRDNFLEYEGYDFTDNGPLTAGEDWGDWVDVLDTGLDLDVALLLEDDCDRVTYTHPEFHQRMAFCKSLVPMTKSARK
jgi:hypothetical protein